MYCKSVPVTFSLAGSGVNWVSLAGVTGEQVPLKDVKAFAAAIDKILSDKKLQEVYAEKAKARILEHFTTAKAVEAMLKAYRELG